MKTEVAVYLGLVSYFTVVAAGLVLFGAGALLSAVFFFVLPIVWLGRQLSLAWSFVGAVAALAIVQAFVWQMIGHASGAWYELSGLAQHLFTVVPLESLLVTAATFLFWILLYEYFCDDRYVERVEVTPRRLWFSFVLGGIGLGALGLAWLYAGIIVPFSFAVMLGVLLVTLLGLMWYLPGQQSLVLEKVLLGVVLLLPLQIIVELVALLNTHVLFAYPEQYIWSFTLVGELVPVEKILAIVVVPVWVLCLHEWVLDDEQ